MGDNTKISDVLHIHKLALKQKKEGFCFYIDSLTSLLADTPSGGFFLRLTVPLKTDFYFPING
jgi:hypothetical protein